MATAHDPLMTTGEFEELARVAARVAEGVPLEFVDGKLGARQSAFDRKFRPLA
ncbi:hypothetical protein [Nocardia lasii]|uniref:Uncharacterized protein n=1 Tax=Nocardia lasii TaxID=1616107 RepID=A0ABW1JY91_9NOCA